MSDGVRLRKPKYRRHTTRDRAFVEFQGRRIYLDGPYKSPESLAAYRDFLRRHDLLNEEVGRTPRHVVGIVNRFLDWAENTYPVGTRSEYMNCKVALNKHLVELDGQTLVADYTPVRLKALQHHLAVGKKSRTYINAVCARVRRMFKWAVSEALCSPSIYHALATVPGLRKGRSAAVEHPKRQPVAWDDVAPVLAELSPTVAAMVLTQWLTGCRPQSVCLARAGQFDQSTDPWTWKLRHKTEHIDSDLVAFIGPKCQAVLAPFVAGRKPDDFLFQPLHLSGKRARGFRAFYDSVSYLRAVRRAIERVNRAIAEHNEGLPEDKRQPLIPHWTPHALRHSRATLVRAEHGLEAAQAALGHRAITATQIYAKRQTDLARRVASEMG